MTKKSIIISVISVICLVGIVSFAMYGCSSKGGNEKKKKNRGVGANYRYKPRKVLRHKEMRLLNLWVLQMKTATILRWIRQNLQIQPRL